MCPIVEKPVGLPSHSSSGRTACRIWSAQKISMGAVYHNGIIHLLTNDHIEVQSSVVPTPAGSLVSVVESFRLDRLHHVTSELCYSAGRNRAHLCRRC